jgi:hypothetical protein
MEEQPYSNYQNSNTKPLPVRRILAITIGILALIVIVQLFLALSIRGKTGLLEVTAPAGTHISISEQNHQATVIGTSSVKVRLEPGTYLLYGVNNGNRTSLVASVSKGQTAHASLQFNKNSGGARSVQSITFQGQAGLLNVGLSVSQVNQIEQDIFQYKPNANTVSIAQNSIEPGPHDPNGNAPFTLTFNVSIDGTPYTATATYSDLVNASLQLANPAGQIVFNSDTVQQNGGD